MSIPQKFKKVSYYLSMFFLILGVFVLSAWIADIDRLKTLSPNFISVKVNTAICFLLAGILMILLHKDKNKAITQILVSVFAFIIFLIGTLTLLEYYAGYNFGIDELFFKDDPWAIETLYPGRQTPFNAVFFSLFGLSFLPYLRKIRRPDINQILVLLVAITAFVTFVAYMFTAGNSYKVYGYDIISFQSSFAFILLALAALFLRPEDGLMKLISSDSIGGRLFRRIFPFCLFIYLILGWLRLKGEIAGYYGSEVGVSLFVIVSIIGFTILLFKTALNLTGREKEQNLFTGQLLNANQNLEKAEEITGLGNWEIDVKALKATWSKQIFRFFGLDPANGAPTANQFFNFLHPDDRPVFKETFLTAVNNIQPENKVFRTNPAIFPLRYVNLTWQLEKNDTGEVIKIFGTAQDITETVLANKKLAQSEELFSKAFHSKVFGLAIVNRERRIVDINKTLTDLLGYNREDFIGKTADEVGLTKNEKYTQKRDELLLEIMQKGRLDNYELEMITHDERTLNLLLSVEGLTLNESPHWLISLVDISAKKRTELELKKNELKFRTLTSSAPVAIFQTDEKGNCNYVNEEWLKYSGMDFDEAMGTSWVNAIHPDDKETGFMEWQSAITGKKDFNSELRFLDKNNNITWLIAKAVPLFDAEKNIYGYIGMASDITERKNAEQQLVQTKESLETAEEQANMGSWEYCLQTDRRIWSKQMFRLFDLDPSEKEPTNEEFLEFTHPDDREIFFRNAGYLLNGLPTEKVVFRTNPQILPLKYFEPTWRLLYDEQGKPLKITGTIYDITERMLNEKKVMESEERYRTLVEQASDAIFIIDDKGRFITINSSACKMTGYTEAELMQKTLYDFVFEDEIKKYPFQFDLLKTGKPITTERRMKSRNDKLIYVEINAKMIDNGKLLVFVRDITERKKTEAEISRVQKEKDTALNRISDKVISVNTNWNYTYLNDAALDEHPLGREKTIGRSIWEVHPEMLGTTIEEKYHEAFNTGQVVEVETYYEPFNTWYYIKIYPSVDGLTIFYQDINERKKVEQEKTILTERNQQTLETMLDGFILADDKGKILDVNPAYCNMIGYSREELLQKNINSIEAKLADMEIESRIAEMLEKKSVKFETTHNRKDKALIDLEVSISIMAFDGRPLVAAFLRDITERKKNQQQIKDYNSQLKQLTAHLQSIREEERRRIGREIHDDLGQQLTAIKMDAAWIDKKTPDESTLIKEKLKNIIGLLDGSNQSVRRILSELKPTILDEYGLLDAMDWQAKQFTSNTGIPVEIVCSKKEIKLPEDIATCIFRIFQESLTNITRYAKAKKVITSVKLSGNQISVTIKDDGKGFDISQISKTETFGILGMRERVNALQGRFIVESVKGKGTLLTVKIPYKA